MSLTPHTLRRRATCMVAMVASALLVGCSTDGNSDGGNTTATFAMGAAPNSLDITKHFDTNVMSIMSLFTEPLERLNSDGSLAPNLAESVEQPDDTTIVYHLRPDVKFSNGDPLTAEDVVWSIKHVSDAKAGAQTASIVKSVAGATADGDDTVTVKLKNPDPTVRRALALVNLVQDAEVARGHGDALGTPEAVPVGTGPYQVTRYSTDGVSLDRNPNYWGKPPGPDSLSFVLISSDNSAQLAMRSGDLQGALVDNATSVPQWEAITGATVYSTLALSMTYFSLDTTAAPFDDLHVRKAIAHAIDREGLLQSAFGGKANLLSGMIPTGALAPIAPTPEAAEKFLADLPTYAFDLDAAKSELAQSKHPDGFDMSVPYIAELAWSKLVVLNLQENLRPLGIEVTPKSMTTQEWVANVFGHKTTEVWPMDVGSATPDPVLLGRLVTEEAMTAPGGYNFAKWAPADLQDAAAILTSSLDKDARWKAAQQILTAMAKDLPYLPLFQPENILVLAGGYSFPKPLGFIEMASGSWIHLLATPAEN